MITMNTAEAIEAMTDAGKFEILATQVLRLLAPECRDLQHIGVNAAGKTIRNPLDAFCKVPGSTPSKYVMAAFSTDAAKSVKNKWIFDHKMAPRAKSYGTKDDGDLIKASREAARIKALDSDATFIVYLCTNKQPAGGTFLAANSCAATLGIDVRFLTRSMLRDFLDVQPDGQWLRKEHLGIECERLSGGLLTSLCRKSRQQYQREFLVTPSDRFIPTSTSRAVSRQLDSPRRLLVLTGRSGSGKSVLAFQQLCHHLHDHGTALWVPGEFVERASSLESLIDTALRNLHPALEPSSGSLAIALATREKPLLLIVDDIQRTGSPTRALEKLISWTQPISGEDELPGTLKVVSPVWAQTWDSIPKQPKSHSWVAHVSMPPLEQNEAVAFLKSALADSTASLSEAQIVSIANELDRDPILLAMFAQSEIAHSPPSGAWAANSVLAQFVQDEIAKASAKGPLLQADYTAALHDTVKWMMINRDLYPRWSRLSSDLEHEALTALREIASRDSICRVTERDGSQRFEFRHDRILGSFLARVLGKMLEDRELNEDVLRDPYFAGFLGQAISTSDIDADTMSWLTSKAPLALVSSIAFVPHSPRGSQHTQIQAAAEWLQHQSQSERRNVSHYYSLHALQSVDSQHVLAVTDGLGSHRAAALARFANGAINMIVAELDGSGFFAPAVTDHALSDALDRGLRTHRLSICEQCTESLSDCSMNDVERRGSLILAGLVGTTIPMDAIQTAWNSAIDRESVLLSALWACLRCTGDEADPLLAQILNEWEALPGDEDGTKRSERGLVADELRFAFRRGLPVAAIHALAKTANCSDDLRWHITHAMSQMQEPEAVVFILQEAARVQREVDKTGGFSHWLHSLMNDWDPNQNRSGVQLPDETRQAIKVLWTEGDRDQTLAKVARRAWIRSSRSIEELRTFRTKSRGYESAVWQRIRLGDSSVASDVERLLSQNNSWFQGLERIWSTRFVRHTDTALEALARNTPSDCTGGRTNEHYILSRLLRDIPPNDSIPLLLKHWECLQYSSLFVQLALFIGSDELVQLASSAINRYPTDANPLEHVNHTFGFHTRGLQDRIQQRHLEVMLPYLDQLSDLTISDMGSASLRLGLGEWRDKHLKPEVDRRRLLHSSIASDPPLIERVGRTDFPSDEDLFDALNRIENYSRGLHSGIYHWSEVFHERRHGHDRWQRILSQWVREKADIRRCTILALAIQDFGKRTDLELLNDLFDADVFRELDWIVSDATFSVMHRSLN